jgi:hypothetical protein
MDINFPTTDMEVKIIMRNIMEDIGLDKISSSEGAEKVIERWDAVLNELCL